LVQISRKIIAAAKQEITRRAEQELQKHRQAQAETARRATPAPRVEPEKVETFDVEWSRWWDPDSGKEFFSKKGTKVITWDPPPAGELWEYGNIISRANPRPDILAGTEIQDVSDTSTERPLPSTSQFHSKWSEFPFDSAESPPMTSRAWSTLDQNPFSV
jgi:hypothetical protein